MAENYWYVDVETLSRLIHQKRVRKGLREIAEEIGDISASTLSRIENQNIPDMKSFLAVCNWLEVHPGNFFVTEQEFFASEQDTADEIKYLLMSDKTLNPTVAMVLSLLIKAAYRDFRQNKTDL